MFYSTQILARKGPLGIIWIAAHMDKNLKRSQVWDSDSCFCLPHDSSCSPSSSSKGGVRINVLHGHALNLVFPMHSYRGSWSWSLLKTKNRCCVLACGPFAFMPPHPGHPAFASAHLKHAIQLIFKILRPFALLAGMSHSGPPGRWSPHPRHRGCAAGPRGPPCTQAFRPAAPGRRACVQQAAVVLAAGGEGLHKLSLGHSPSLHVHQARYICMPPALRVNPQNGLVRALIRMLIC